MWGGLDTVSWTEILERDIGQTLCWQTVLPSISPSPASLQTSLQLNHQQASRLKPASAADPAVNSMPPRRQLTTDRRPEQVVHLIPMPPTGPQPFLWDSYLLTLAARGEANSESQRTLLFQPSLKWLLRACYCLASNEDKEQHLNKWLEKEHRKVSDCCQIAEFY